MKSLYVLLLLTGSVPLVLSFRLKYFLIQQETTWSDAQAYCQAKYTDLATVKNNEHMLLLQSETQKQQFSSSAWIGLYNDISSWRWSFGNEPLGSMRKWTYGEPNNSGGRQECATINKAGYADKACTITIPFICFDESKNGSDRYILISSQMTWREAQSYCRQHHTDLAIITTDTEFSVVKGLVSNDAWIGLFRDSWKWIDGTNFSTISWMGKKPDNLLKNENCGYLEVTSSQAADAQCSDTRPFICYLGTTGKKQAVKVKIRSSQDMKDPKIQTAILEQVRQKLKDVGMTENITVKWRERVDGSVLHKEKKKRINTTSPEKCAL